MGRKKPKQPEKEKAESLAKDPALDSAYEGVLERGPGNRLIHKQGCYRKKRLPGCS